VKVRALCSRCRRGWPQVDIPREILDLTPAICNGCREKESPMKIQEDIRQLRRHVELVEILGISPEEIHNHMCDLCEHETACGDTFYVRRGGMEDTVLCRLCGQRPDVQRLFPQVKRLLRLGSNMTDQWGTFTGEAAGINPPQNLPLKAYGI